MGYIQAWALHNMRVADGGSEKADGPKKIILAKLSRRTKILAYGLFCAPSIFESIIIIDSFNYRVCASSNTAGFW
jgi:hypothetical protein